jgi:hypothetical protein
LTISIALAASAANAQRSGGAHSAGSRGRFGEGHRPGGPSFGGVHLAPATPELLPGSDSPLTVGPGAPRLRLRFGRGSHRGYGFWPLYGWGWSWAPDCPPDAEGDCYGASIEAEAGKAEPPASPEIRLNSVLVVYLRDGSGYGVTDYWVADSMLHFVTTYDAQKSIPFEDVDWQRTVDENASRGVYFKLSYAPAAPRREAATAPSCPANPIEGKAGGRSNPQIAPDAGLLGASGSAAGQGVRVASVRDGSPAAQLGIHPGDVVLRIDCQPVHSNADIESALTANSNGAPWISYLIKGAWLSEQQIKLR